MISGTLVGFTLMAGKIGTVIGAGFGLATAFQLFHDKELKFNKKSKKEEVESNDRIENLRKRISTSR